MSKDCYQKSWTTIICILLSIFLLIPFHDPKALIFSIAFVSGTVYDRKFIVETVGRGNLSSGSSFSFLVQRIVVFKMPPERKLFLFHLHRICPSSLIPNSSWIGKRSTFSLELNIRHFLECSL